MTDKDKKKIDYQFVPVPTNLLFVLDPDCLMAITIMIDKESYWKSREKLFNGYFTLSVQELAEYLRFQNKQDVRLTLEALYRAGLVDVKAESGKRLGAKIKLNWDKIKSDDIDYVEKLPRGTKITYCPNTESTTGSTKCTPTLEKEIETDIEKKKDKEIDIEKDINTNYTTDFSSIQNSFLKAIEEDYKQKYITSIPLKDIPPEEDNCFSYNDLNDYYNDSFKVIEQLERMNKERDDYG